MKKVKENPKIDESFRRNERKPVETVGELIKELQLLPHDMVLDGGFGDGKRVYVTEMWCSDPYLACCIEDNED